MPHTKGTEIMDFAKGKGGNALKNIAEKKQNSNIIDISIDKIEPCMKNHYNMRNIQELADNIKDNGLLEHLVVVRSDNGMYQLLSGHRRFEAVKLLSWERVKCEIKETKNQLEFVSQLIAYNCQRKKTLRDYAGEIQLWSEALKEDGFKGDILDELCRKFGKGKSTIQRYQSFNKLIPKLQDLFDEQVISIRSLMSTAKLDEDKQQEIYNTIFKNLKPDTRLSEKEYTEFYNRIINPDSEEHTADDEVVIASDVEEHTADDKAVTELDAEECTADVKPVGYEQLVQTTAEKWNGFDYEKIIKKAILNFLYDDEIKKAQNLNNSDFTIMIRENHKTHDDCSGGVEIMGAFDKLIINLGSEVTGVAEKSIWLTWSMTARFVRMWTSEDDSFDESKTNVTEESEEEVTSSDDEENTVKVEEKGSISKLSRFNSAVKKLDSILNDMSEDFPQESYAEIVEKIEALIEKLNDEKDYIKEEMK